MLSYGSLFCLKWNNFIWCNTTIWWQNVQYKSSLIKKIRLSNSNDYNDYICYKDNAAVVAAAAVLMMMTLKPQLQRQNHAKLITNYISVLANRTSMHYKYSEIHFYQIFYNCTIICPIYSYIRGFIRSCSFYRIF